MPLRFSRVGAHPFGAGEEFFEAGKTPSPAVTRFAKRLTKSRTLPREGGGV